MALQAVYGESVLFSRRLVIPADGHIFAINSRFKDFLSFCCRRQVSREQIARKLHLGGGTGIIVSQSVKRHREGLLQGGKAERHLFELRLCIQQFAQPEESRVVRSLLQRGRRPELNGTVACQYGFAVYFGSKPEQLFQVDVCPGDRLQKMHGDCRAGRYFPAGAGIYIFFKTCIGQTGFRAGFTTL